MLSWLHDTFQPPLDENKSNSPNEGAGGSPDAAHKLVLSESGQVVEEGTVPELFGAQAHFQALTAIAQTVITFYVLAKNPELVRRLIRLLTDSKPFLTHGACPRELRFEMTSLILRLEHMKSRHMTRSK